MSWWQFAVWGAVGGGIVEVLALFGAVLSWQSGRRLASGRIKSNPPSLLRYVDIPAHVIIFPMRCSLGAGAAIAFWQGGQISGTYAALAIGFSAPSLLAQLGSIDGVADKIVDPSEKKTIDPRPRSARNIESPQEVAGE